MEAAGLSVALVTLPVAIIQAAREIRETISRFQNASKELSGLAAELDSLLDCAARINTLGSLEKDTRILNQITVQQWNQSVGNLIRIVERLYADVRRLEKKNLQGRLLYAFGLDGIRDRQQELSRAVGAVNFVVNTFTATQQVDVTHRLVRFELYFQRQAHFVTKLSGANDKVNIDLDSFRLGFYCENLHMIDHFVTRPDYIEALRNNLMPGSPPRRRVCILHGLGGIGKTQLAIRFARDHQEIFSCIFFLDGSSMDSLSKGFAMMHRRITGRGKQEASMNPTESGGLSIKQMTDEVIQWLSHPSNSTWLLIVDNLDKEPSDEGGYDITPFLPHRDHGSVLITSRLATFSHLGQCVKVGRMTNEEASALLQHCAGGMARSSGRKSTPALLSTLDGLPLAIAQAGRFIRTLNVSPESYLQTYGSERREIIDSLSAESSLQDADKGSIRTTWNISLKILQDKVSKHGSKSNHFAAYRLLQLFAYFHPSDLSFDTLRRGLVSNSIPMWFRNTFASKLRFLGVVRILLDLSLIDNNTTEGSYSMHRVVHDWLCLYAACDRDPELLRLAVSAVSFSAPLVLTRLWAEDQQQLALHAVQLLPRLDNFDPLDFLVRFDRLSGQDLEVVTSLLHGEPKRAWELMRFAYALGNILGLLKSSRKLLESHNLLQKTRLLLAVQQARGPSGGEEDRRIVAAMLEYFRPPDATVGGPPWHFDSLRDEFRELGSIPWAIKAQNYMDLYIGGMGRQDLAVRAWREALATAQVHFDTIFIHPAFMVFTNLAGSIQGSPTELLLLMKMVELDALRHLDTRPEAPWVLTILRKLRAGDYVPHIGG
ncbi:hypothetical protein OQA88_1144 [Cercophora sp. LCS_1]